MKLRITVHGNAYDVEVEILDPGEGFPAGPLPRIAPATAPQIPPHPTPGPIAKPSSAKPRPNNFSGDSQDTVNSPIAGTIFEVKCKAGEKIQINQELLIIEAMKMETSIAAPIAGTIKKVNVSVGDAVREGQALVQFE